MEFQIILFPEGDGFAAVFPHYPGLRAHGATLGEAKANASAALRARRRMLGETPEPVDVFGSPRMAIEAMGDVALGDADEDWE